MNFWFGYRMIPLREVETTRKNKSCRDVGHVGTEGSVTSQQNISCVQSHISVMGSEEKVKSNL